MFASGPFYTSGTFWAAALFVVGVATLLVMFIIWRLGNPRRQIVYSLPIVTSLLSSHAPVTADGKIEVTFNGKPVRNPYLVELLIESRSRKDISSSDFDQGKPVMIHLGTPFAAPIELDDAGNIENVLAAGGTGGKVMIRPCLIRKGLLARIQFLTEGPPTITCESPLIDVEMREGSGDPGDSAVSLAAAVSSAAVILPFGGLMHSLISIINRSRRLR